MASDILVVDDEKDIRLVLTDVLEDEGYKVRTASDGVSAINEVKRQRPSLILLDIWLGDSRFDGIKALEIINKDYPETQIIMMSGHGNIQTAVSSIKKGAYDFIEKPFKSDRLLLLIKRALEVSKLRGENKFLKKEIKEDSLVGSSPNISQIKQLIQKVSSTNSRVFITGPSGSGKGLVASEIHKKSNRSKCPFIVVNCSTLNHDRFEEELFGIEGSIEDTSSSYIGLLEKSHTGTIVFDQITEMPLPVQARVARFLQDGKVQRIGSQESINSDVRVIATSSMNIEDELKKANIKEDLYYRLNVVPIKIKPLIHRKEDIIELTKYFLDQSCATYSRPKQSFSDETLTALQTYSWPGNIRQLRNIVDWVVIMLPESFEGAIKPELLPPDISSTLPSTLFTNNSEDILQMPLRDAREAFEKQYLVSQVSRFSGNISQTASFVGMERSALHRKLRALGVTRKDSAA